MARREKARSTVRRAGAAIKRAAKKVTTKLRPRRRTAKSTIEEPVQARATTRATPKVKTPRAVKRPADVPMDEITRTYAPKQTSLKASFRASGAERQRDQDVPGESWNDEDHYTNKSGDPRIGTHGRAYEPGEKR
jgi:hypothetical protein